MGICLILLYFKTIKAYFNYIYFQWYLIELNADVYTFGLTISQFLTPYMTENIILDKHTVNAV